MAKKKTTGSASSNGAKKSSKASASSFVVTRTSSGVRVNGYRILSAKGVRSIPRDRLRKAVQAAAGQ